MSLSGDKQSWTVTAPTYSSNVGRTSSLAAARLIDMANKLGPITHASRILDNGAGTGAVTLTAASNFPGAAIHATDTSASMLESISKQNLPNVTTQVLDARALGSELKAGTFSHAFATFMLQTITTPRDVIDGMAKVLAPGGVIGIALWGQRNGPFEVWERSCQVVDPSYALPDDPFDDPKAWRSQGELEGVLADSGFSELKTEEVTMPFEFPSPEAFLDFWFNAKNPAALKCMSNWTGDVNKVKEAMLDVVKDEYSGGKDIQIWAVLGVGKK